MSTRYSQIRAIRNRIGRFLGDKLGIPTIASHTQALVTHGDCRTALDIGCGISSQLNRFRPRLRTIGVDAHAPSIGFARQNGVHDHYILSDIIGISITQLKERIEECIGESQVDLVTAYGVVEHLPKRDGWRLMEQCEALSRKYVLLETPNGFVEQGPEFGNPMQRHLSGWFPHDFEGIGYSVYGTTGTKYLRGYMGEAKIKLPGSLVFDQVVLGRVLRCVSRPRHAFNILAIKDVRGARARYASRDEFRQEPLPFTHLAFQ